MSDYPKWPHLENLDRVLKDVPDYLSRAGTPGLASYVVTEKVHGFNARFGVLADGTPWIGSRNQTVAAGMDEAATDSVLNADDAGLQGFVGYAKRKVVLLSPGKTIFGEWAGKGIQKGIDYGERNFYAFGYMIDGKLQPFEALEDVCEDLAILPVPVIVMPYWSAPLTPERLQDLRDGPSRLAPGGGKGEGIVIYPWPPITDPYGNVVIAKYKTPGFEERTRFRAPKGEEPDLTKVTGFAEDYVNEQRLEHVLAQVAEMSVPAGNGEWTFTDALDVRHTGDVMRAMYEDVMREGKADFDALPEAEQKQAGKVINRLTKELLLAMRDKAMVSLAN